MTATDDVRVELPPARHQLAHPDQGVLHSANAGVIVERTAQIREGCARQARAVSREMAERINASGLATVLVFEETFGTRDRLHWLLHLESFADYPALAVSGGATDVANGVFGAAPGHDGLFVAGSVHETVLLPHRWGMHGTATEAMAGDPAADPLAPGADPPRFVVCPAQEQTSLPSEQTLNSATAGVVMRRTVDFRYEFRAEARVFARTVAETVNLNMRGLASVLLYEQPFGPMDRVHLMIHMRSLDVYYLLMGLDARTDPDAPRADYLRQWISMDKGGGSWDRIIVGGSTVDSALTPQRWADRADGYLAAP